MDGRSRRSGWMTGAAGGTEFKRKHPGTGPNALRGGQAIATFHSRPRTGPVALRGGRLGAARAPPARGPGTVCASGVGSAMASPPRLSFTQCVHSLDRARHACEHPQRARDPWPEASTSAKSGSLRTEYSRVPPGRAVVVEAERSRVERGRPRDRGPARSGGCGGTSKRSAQSEGSGRTSNRPDCGIGRG
jgi:hypothetical protein